MASAKEGDEPFKMLWLLEIRERQEQMIPSYQGGAMIHLPRDAYGAGERSPPGERWST